jgi:hypothetical protein
MLPLVAGWLKKNPKLHEDKHLLSALLNLEGPALRDLSSSSIAASSSSQLTLGLRASNSPGELLKIPIAELSIELLNQGSTGNVHL